MDGLRNGLIGATMSLGAAFTPVAADASHNAVNECVVNAIHDNILSGTEVTIADDGNIIFKKLAEGKASPQVAGTVFMNGGIPSHAMMALQSEFDTAATGKIEKASQLSVGQLRYEQGSMLVGVSNGESLIGRITQQQLTNLGTAMKNCSPKGLGV